MSSTMQNKASLPVIKRLPKYYRYLSNLQADGRDKISSSELARMMGTTASQVRQDFNCFGGFGQQGIGYKVDVLLTEIGKLLFGNGERTGNLDIVTVGLNMFTQGVDPKLDFSNLPKYKEIYERCTNMKIHERTPYIGELVFTAFSGSHQDAINKGMEYMKESGSDYWEIPYLPIDPADVGRQYEPIIRINSQSGKGGAAFVMANNYGYKLPKQMHPEFSKLVQKKCDELGRELVPGELMEIFEENYINTKRKYEIVGHPTVTEIGDDKIRVTGLLRTDGDEKTDVNICGEGNGPIDAFFRALASVGVCDYKFINYEQHAISTGSDSKAVSYIQLMQVV